MKKIYYYEAANLMRYVKYANSYPLLTVDEVIWQVNANLDIPFYRHIVPIKNTNIHPLVVNKYFKLPHDFYPHSLIKIPETNFYAHEKTVHAFLDLKRDAALEHLNISVLSAFRSISYQQKLYESYLKIDPPEVVDTYSARPGHSEHHTGYALDICVTDHELDTFEGTKESDWVQRHAHEYGFIIRYLKDTTHLTGYKYEPWHITYVGISCAYLLKQQQIKTLEEYKVKYIDHYPHEMI